MAVHEFITHLYILLTLFSLGGGGGGGAHCARAYFKLITKSPKLVTFPKIYQRKFSCVNDVSMMIDVSIATIFSGVYFAYFLSFFSLFSVFTLRLQEKDNPLFCFCVYFD